MSSESLKEFDDRINPDEDSYETEPKLVKHFAEIYNLDFKLDVSATYENRKCFSYISKEENALLTEWKIVDPNECVDVWCNHPHSLNEEFLRRANAQWMKHNINICMLIPANTMSTDYYKELIENETEYFIENHPVQPRPKFLKNGRPVKMGSRNAYQVLIWRKT